MSPFDSSPSSSDNSSLAKEDAMEVDLSFNFVEAVKILGKAIVEANEKDLIAPDSEDEEPSDEEEYEPFQSDKPSPRRARQPARAAKTVDKECKDEDQQYMAKKRNSKNIKKEHSNGSNSNSLQNDKAQSRHNPYSDSPTEGKRSTCFDLEEESELIILMNQAALEFSDENTSEDQETQLRTEQNQKTESIPEKQQHDLAILEDIVRKEIEVKEMMKDLIMRNSLMEEEIFKEETKNKVSKIQAQLPHITVEEAEQALLEINNEDDAIKFLSDIQNIQTVQKKLEEIHRIATKKSSGTDST